jgi:hypothetical protein
MPINAANYNRIISACLLAFANGCVRRNLCEDPQSRSQNVVIRDTTAFEDIVVNQTMDNTPYTICLAKPVPAVITMMVPAPVMTPMGPMMQMFPQRISLDSVEGVSRGAGREDCRDEAREACEEALTYFFEQYGGTGARPNGLRCAIAKSEGCRG